MRHLQGMIPSEQIETELRAEGFKVIVGIDEVGRGAWAGPLVVGAVILPPNRRILGLRDSKLLSPVDRETIANRLKTIAVSWSVGVVEVHELDELGLGRSLGVAAQRAIEGLGLAPSPTLRKSPSLDSARDKPDTSEVVPTVQSIIALVDGKYPFRGLDIEQRTIVSGDRLVRSIAAASVIAKVERDRMMRTLHRSDPSVRRFRFDQNKGYPSSLHRQLLTELGPTPHHRTCFTPVQLALNRHLELQISV